MGALAASSTLTACGGSTPSATGANPGDGKLIFTNSCGSCHTLGAAGTNGSNGPVLTSSALTAAEVSMQVLRGGGGMPSFDGDLTDQQIKAVSEFVAENDGSN
ncbi:MAG: cytochrome c [Solirubrobacterales bacterium]|nr:cytochrome c [Solirubrobacterales bacterium]